MSWLTSAKIEVAFFIFQRLYYLGIIEKFFKNQIDYALPYLRTYFLQYLPILLMTLLSNNVDIKVKVGSLFDDFEKDGIVFLFFASCLDCNNEFYSYFINDVPDFIFF